MLVECLTPDCYLPHLSRGQVQHRESQQQNRAFDSRGPRVQTVEFDPAWVVVRDIIDGDHLLAQYLHLRTNCKHTDEGKADHDVYEQIARCERRRQPAGDARVNHRRDGKDDSAGDRDGMQDAQTAIDDIARQLSRRQNAGMKDGGREDESKENDPAYPGDERQQHQVANDGHMHSARKRHQLSILVAPERSYVQRSGGR